MLSSVSAITTMTLIKIRDMIKRLKILAGMLPCADASMISYTRRLMLFMAYPVDLTET